MTPLQILFAILPLGTFFAGIAIERYKKKYIVIEKEVSVQRIALAVNDQFYGTIEVKYNGIPAQNIYFINYSLDNISNSSISDFELLISVPKNYVIFKDSALLNNGEVNFTLNWTNAFMENITAHVTRLGDPDQAPLVTPEDIIYFQRHRPYRVSTLNKGKSITGSLLVGGPADLDTIAIGIYLPDVELITKMNLQLKQKKKADFINWLTVLFWFGSAWMVIRYSTSITIGVIGTIIGYFISYFLGNATHYVFTFLKQYFRR